MMRSLSTPPGPKGVLCEPPLSTWSDVAQANRVAAEKWDFDILGVSGARLRTDARRMVLRLAGLTSDGAEGDEASPLFVTGHQPEFYHPGVWMKAFAVTEAAGVAGGLGLNWVVDHDAGELAAQIPTRRRGSDGADGELSVEVRRLVAAGAGTPFETLPAPTPLQADAFVEAVDTDLKTVRLRAERELWRTFADGLLRLLEDELSAADIGWRSRATYERTLGHELIPDVPLSLVCGTKEFLWFFVYWVQHAEGLLQAYNRALAHVRGLRSIRSAANPFPDLSIRPDGAVELPFWGLTDAGIRRKLYVHKEGHYFVLSHLEGEFAKIPLVDGKRVDGEQAVGSLLEAGVQVRPRAVPLTVFSRLFVADLFVHGTGGARYDEVTDRLIEDFFGVEPPTFAVVSATVHLPLQDLPVQPSALWALQHKLRDLQFNPQRYAWEAMGSHQSIDEKLGPLLREKERLIDEIRNIPRGSPASSSRGPSPKRVLTRAIEKANAELYALLTDVERDTERRLARLQSQARSGAAATRRTYPFFLYDPAQMWTLMRSGGG